MALFSPPLLLCRLIIRPRPATTGACLTPPQPASSVSTRGGRSSYHGGKAVRQLERGEGGAKRGEDRPGLHHGPPPSSTILDRHDRSSLLVPIPLRQIDHNPANGPSQHTPTSRGQVLKLVKGITGRRGDSEERSPPKPPEMEGYLDKLKHKSSIFGSWNRRYFVVDPEEPTFGRILYYPSKEHYKRGEIPSGELTVAAMGLERAKFVSWDSKH
jgi:hypothetical protein